MNFHNFLTKSFFWKDEKGATIFSYGYFKLKHYLIQNVEKENRLKKILTWSYVLIYLSLLMISTTKYLVLCLCITAIASYIIMRYETKSLIATDHTLDDRARAYPEKRLKSGIKLSLTVMLMSIASFFAACSVYDSLINSSFDRVIIIVMTLIVVSTSKIVNNILILKRKNKIANNQD